MSTPPNPSRFFGLALGKYDNFRSVSSGVIAAGDTNPDVSKISLLYAQTGGTLTLDNFDNGAEGQILVLVNCGTQIRYATSGYLKVSTDASATWTIDTFINHYTTNSSVWYQVSKSINLADV